MDNLVISRRTRHHTGICLWLAVGGILVSESQGRIFPPMPHFPHKIAGLIRGLRDNEGGWAPEISMK